MSEKVATKETKEVLNETANAAGNTKKKRRGISNETRATTQLKFHERDASVNGLFVGHIKEVLVDWRTLKDDVKGLPSFAGLSIPRFVLHYVSPHPIAEQRHNYLTLLPVESNIDTIEGGSLEWKANNLFNWIKHLLNVFYLKNRELTEQEIDALTLPFEDVDDEGQYVPVEPEVVVTGYQTLFENVASMLNGTFNLADGETAKPCYIDKTGKPYLVWSKQLRYMKVKNDWRAVGNNGDLAFPTFPGEGVFEIMKGQNVPPLIHINNFNESITPKEVKKAPNFAPNMPGMPVMPTGAGGGMPNQQFGSEQGFGASAGFNDGIKEDLPF